MTVEFVARVPENTPPGQGVFLSGDGPELGEWRADGLRLEGRPDGTWHGRAAVEAGQRFLATLGRWRLVEGDGGSRERPERVVPAGADRVELAVAGWGRHAHHYHPDFRSRFLPQARTIAVWVPPGYDREPHRRFPVLYLHDGQNLFDPQTAFAGQPWWADEVTEHEVRAGRVAPLLLVGVANTPDRLREYGPRPCGPGRADDLSRAYGRFLVEEVKPFIDSHYRTLDGPEHTGVGGSSMGGLISLYLCRWYPGVFGRCAALSPSLWWDRESFRLNLGVYPVWLGRCRVWLDMGTREGNTDEAATALVRRARRLARELERHGLRPGEGLWYEEVEGGQHNEAAWGGRLGRVLRFLFPAGDDVRTPRRA
jgi:predicted alpha/beta superfamily hydrolase